MGDEHDSEGLLGAEWWFSNLLEEECQSACSHMYIDGEVIEEDGLLWWLTSFYGEACIERKALSWKALRTLNAVRCIPWLCMGGFNEFLVGYEKEGGLQGLKDVWTDLKKL